MPSRPFRPFSFFGGGPWLSRVKSDTRECFCGFRAVVEFLQIDAATVSFVDRHSFACVNG